ncbi:MAG: iron complex outermembrane receptor protein [Granulosicoccus sp.]|jgi:iron complex outermembrane receptor protein
MFRIGILSFVLSLSVSVGFGQSQPDSTKLDTLFHQYQPVVISAFEQNSDQLMIAGGISVIQNKDLHFGHEGSVAQSINRIPGVKMEERGVGGSRRLNIRGSALRAPFGVRNVRAYYGGFALTSPDGSTPLEVIDPTMMESIEVIKGPASSIYGAGTGGAIIFNPKRISEGVGKIELSGMMGSYGLGRADAKVMLGFKKGDLILGYSNQHYGGYRVQESVDREQFHLLSTWETNPKGKISIMAFHYRGSWGLAGAIDSASVAEDPRQAATYSNDHDAHVGRERTRFGVGIEQQLGKVVNVKVNGYGNFTSKENPYGTSPFFQGWKRETAQGFGTRALLDWNLYTKGKTRFSLLTGAEYQNESNSLNEYKNILGNEGDLKFDHETTSEQTMAFADLRYQHEQWVVTLGASMNRLNYYNENFFNQDSADLSKNVIFDPAFSPRVSVLKSFGQATSLHGSVSWGFSAPTVWEVISSNGGLNDSINPEVGLNYELGIKGQPLERLRYDVTGYVMQMRNTIVPREDSNGVEYFENSGFTTQSGLEALLSYSFIDVQKHPVWTVAQIQTSYAFQSYKYSSYISGGDTLNGNFLPGVPQHSLSADIKLGWKIGFYFEGRYRFVDEVPLNNKNTDFASAYSLLDFELGYEKVFFGHLKTTLYAGINNLLNTQYSSYYRLNGFGGKYHNPSAGINYYGGLKLSYAFNLTQLKK